MGDNKIQTKQLDINRKNQFCNRLTFCNDLKESFACLMAELSSYGILHGMYAVGVGRKKNIPITFAVISSYPEAFMKAYTEKDMFQHDEGVQWAISNDETLIWDEVITEGYYSKEAEQVDRLAAKYGIRYGFSIPLLGQNSQVFGGVGLSATGIDKETFHSELVPRLPEVEALCQLFSRATASFSKYQEMKGRGKLQFPVLTQNEIEVLAAISRGIELKEIAQMRNTGVDNINAFSRNIRRKLKAENLPQAIYKASVLHIIWTKPTANRNR